MRDGWQQTTLGEVSTRVIGRTPRRSEPSFWTSDTSRPFFTIADMRERYVTAGREGITEEAIIAGQAKEVPAGSLLLSFKLSIGRVAITDREVFPNEAIAWVKPDPGIMRDYLALSLENVEWDGLGGRAVKGRTLNARSLSAVPIPLPPLAEQRRIVDLVGALDDAIEAAETAARTADTTYEQLGTQLQDTDAPAIALSDLVSVGRAGGTPSRKNPSFYGGDIPWVKSGEVGGVSIQQTEECLTRDGLEGSSAWMVPAGAVLVAMYGATAAQVGRLEVPAATNQAVLALIADESRIRTSFLYHLLRSDARRLKSLAQGAAQPNLSKTVLFRQQYRVPGLDQQVSSAELMESVMMAAQHARTSAEALRVLRENLLASLLSGEHEIPMSYDELIGEEAGA